MLLSDVRGLFLRPGLELLETLLQRGAECVHEPAVDEERADVIGGKLLERLVPDARHFGPVLVLVTARLLVERHSLGVEPLATHAAVARDREEHLAGGLAQLATGLHGLAQQLHRHRETSNSVKRAAVSIRRRSPKTARVKYYNN